MTRRSIRLRGFDYSQPGVYYVAISTRNAQPVLGRLVKGRVILSNTGLLVERIWRTLPEHYPCLRLDLYHIMPTHLQGILVIRDQPWTGQQEAFSRPTRSSLPTMIRCFKAACTRELRCITGDPRQILWQGRYLERVIRNRAELASLRAFVRDNPLWHRLGDREHW
jgi:hypothetical protein